MPNRADKINDAAWRHVIAEEHLKNLLEGISAYDSYQSLAGRERVHMRDIIHAYNNSLPAYETSSRARIPTVEWDYTNSDDVHVSLRTRTREGKSVVEVEFDNADDAYAILLRIRSDLAARYFHTRDDT